MEKSDVIAFFDRCAPSWEHELVRNEEVITKILDNAGVCAGIDVLDVACGTGVLFEDYFLRGVASLTAIDISPEMVKRAREKHPTVLCGDVETTEFDKKFDVIMVYNAFPHFPEPARLIERLSGLLKQGGRLSVAHGMSREKLIAHHEGRAQKVSIELLEAQQLAELFEKYLCVEVSISDETMYQLVGRKN